MVSPLFSIITVVYNSETLLEDTLKSILQQTSDKFELIIIDGGSTDGTLEIIKKYEDKIDFWISEKDRGIYDAMNKGIRQAKGQYIWFINSGDSLFSENTLKDIEDMRVTADVYYGETMLIDVQGKQLGTRTEMTTRKLPAQLSWKNMVNGMVVSHQSILVKRNIAPLFDLQYKCSADVDWVIKSLKEAGTVINTQTILSNYLVGGFSISNQKSCLVERFNIYLNHFGLLKTLIAHVKLLFGNMQMALAGKKNY